MSEPTQGKYGETTPDFTGRPNTEAIGVYYVDGVGYCTGLAWAEEQAASFTDKPPVFVEWDYICFKCEGTDVGECVCEGDDER